MANDDDTLNIQGILYCHADSGAVAGVPDLALTTTIINGANNQTLFCGYTVPRGKVGVLFRGEFGLELEGNAGSLAEFAKAAYYSRRFGKLFKIKKVITLLVGGNSSYMDTRTFTDIIPSMTDIKLTAQEVSQTMGLWGTFDMLLIDEDMFYDKYLKAIGQVGY